MVSIPVGLPRRVARERRNLVSHQFLDLVQSRHCQGMSKFTVCGRRADAQSLRGPLDDGILVFLLHAAVHDGILVGEFEFPHFTIDIDLPALVQLGGTECSGPIVLEFAKPEFERVRGIDALWSVRLHQSKNGDRRKRNPLCNPELDAYLPKANCTMLNMNLTANSARTLVA